MDELVSLKSSFDSLDEDFFIGEILSRVDSAQSIVGLGMASKRFQTLCSYPSVLEFKYFPYNDIGSIKYLDKFLDARTKSKIKHEFRRLHIRLPEKTNLPMFMDFVTFHLLGWFNKALSLNVQELILSFHGEPIGSDFYLDRPELMNLQQHSMIPMKNLRVLTLDDIPITLNDSFGDWVSTCCVSLQELNLSDVLVLPAKLTITSSSLRVFTIDGDFKELNVVSAPKLELLNVTWDLINLDRDESHPLIKISDTPNLQGLKFENFDRSYNSWRYGSSGGGGGDTKFPSLKFAGVLLPEKNSPIPLDSLKRLLNDISQTISLRVSDTILHKISQGGITHYAKLFRMLLIFHVHIEGDDEESSWWEKADSIMSFVKNIPSLKIFKLTTENDYYDLQTSLEWLQNALYLNVRVLDLQFDDNNDMNNYCYLDIPELNLHHDYPLSHLKVLTLKNIPIGLNQNFEDWVSNCCVNLKELNLSGVFVVPSKLRITSSSLRVFTIVAHFKHLHVVSAPELVTLHVTWNLVYHGTHETKLSLRVSDSPKLEDFLLSNMHTSLPLEYHNCSNNGDQSNFPRLKSATVKIPKIDNNISLNSLERLLLDISQTRKLCVSGTILHKISCSGIIHSAKLHVCVEVVNEKTRWLEKVLTIKTFVDKVPSLKTFKLTTEDGDIYSGSSSTRVLILAGAGDKISA